MKKAGANEQNFNSTQKVPNSRGGDRECDSPEKRFLGAAAQVNPFDGKSSRMQPSEKYRSNAQMTVLASSLKDDDLMISSSQVDPLEKNSMRGGKSGLGGSDKLKGKVIAPEDIRNLVIKEEEGSSLKSVSPLTDASPSKKSNKIEGSPALPPAYEVFQDHQMPEGTQLPTLPKKGLPPKSPLLASKMKTRILSPTRNDTTELP